MPKSNGSKRAGGAQPSPDAAASAVAKLLRSGLTEAQLAAFAAATPERIKNIRARRNVRLTPRERQLVAAAAEHVRAVVEQQEGILFLLEFGLRRTDIAMVTGAHLPTVNYWFRRRDKITLAGGEHAEKLKGLVARAREAAAGGESIEDRAVLRKVLGVARAPRRVTGRRPEEEVRRLQEKMREGGLWPPKVRAKVLASLSERGAVTRREVMKRLRVGRDLFYSLLDPADDAVMSEEMIARAAKMLEEPSWEERFRAAMTTILGPERMAQGFKPADPDKLKLIARLEKATGFTGRHLRRLLPPYTAKWKKKRSIGLETIETLERVARRMGRRTAAPADISRRKR